MHRLLVLAISFALVILSTPVAARGGHSSFGGHWHSGAHSFSGRHSYSDSHSHTGGHSIGHHGKSVPHSDGGLHGHSSRAPNVRRDSHGRIQRSAEAKAQFKKVHPCPSTGKRSGACPGYVIDHIQPLKRGGADAPSNMQWQTVQAAKLKDRTE